MSDLKPDKNTSVFLDGALPHVGDLSHAEARRGGEIFSRKERKNHKAGGPTSVSATIDRSGWKRVRLGDFESHRNNTCARSLMTSDSGSVHNIHYGDILVKYDEVVSLLHHNVDCLTVEGETNSPKDYICDGDVIIADTAEDETVGKTVEIQDVGNSKVVAGLHTFLYRPPSNMFVRGWLGYWMNSRAYHSQLFQYMTGTKVLSLTRASIAATVIQYPSRELQQQIVTALDSIQTQINATQKLIAKYEAIKKATVNLLLEPKAGWKRMKLDEICMCLDNYRKPVNEVERASMHGDIPYCGANGIVDYVNDFTIDDSIILIAEDGGYFDQYESRPIAYRMSGKAWINNHAHILKAKRDYCQDFIFYSLEHKDITPFITSGTRAKLTKGELSNIEIDTPPSFQEQCKIAEQITAIDNVLADYKAQLEKAQQLKAGMMSYFFG